MGTDWTLLGKPPPTTAADWEEEFDKYRQSPEFKWKNSQITLNEFKFIWYMEYGHRMWGRSIGAFFYIPAIAFWASGKLTPALKKRVLIAGGLLGFQGLLGWYMVKSGLDHNNFLGPCDVPRVSQYRLAAHLSSAVVLYSFLFWSAKSVLRPSITWSQVTPSMAAFRKLVIGSKALAFITLVSGAFVAGLDAGLVYNSFPKFADRWIPEDILAFSPTLRNITENPTTVQFNHHPRHLHSGSSSPDSREGSVSSPSPSSQAHCIGPWWHGMPSGGDGYHHSPALCPCSCGCSSSIRSSGNPLIGNVAGSRNEVSQDCEAHP